MFFETAILRLNTVYGSKQSKALIPQMIQKNATTPKEEIAGVPEARGAMDSADRAPLALANVKRHAATIFLDWERCVRCGSNTNRQQRTGARRPVQ